MAKEPVDYTIVSRPDHIRLECPHCEEELEIDFEDVNFHQDNWSDGGYCTCTWCGKEIELGDWDYD